MYSIVFVCLLTTFRIFKLCISQKVKGIIIQNLLYYFYIKTNILQDFHICISVLLSDFDKNAREISFFSKCGREGDEKRKQNAGEILERREIW